MPAMIRSTLRSFPLGRLLAPHFGRSLTVWAAIIASVIAALSVGYPLGGWLADRFGGKPVLAGGVVIWSLFTAITPPAAAGRVRRGAACPADRCRRPCRR